MKRDTVAEVVLTRDPEDDAFWVYACGERGQVLAERCFPFTQRNLSARRLEAMMFARDLVERHGCRYHTNLIHGTTFGRRRHYGTAQRHKLRKRIS